MFAARSSSLVSHQATSTSLHFAHKDRSLPHCGLLHIESRLSALHYQYILNMTGQPRKKSRPEKHADNDNAVKAILHAIDQLDVKLETKEQQCKEIAKVIKQKKLTYQDGDTRSVYDEEWLRTSFNSTLGNQLVSSYLHYNPRHKPIWEHGSKAIRTSYLELIGFISNETESESEERAPEAHVDAIARPTECRYVKCDIG